MLIPESLWVPSNKDVRSQFAPQRVARRSSLSLAQTIITSNIIAVPADYVFYLTSLIVQSVANAAQNVTFTRAAIVNEAGETIATLTARVVSPAPVRDDLVWTGIVVLMPREILQLESDFNAGVAANTHGGGAFGVLVPRGNWQLD